MGYEYNPAAEEVNFIGNWVAHPETPNLPMVTFGTSSDRIFTPAGYQNYFVTFAKSIPENAACSLCGGVLLRILGTAALSRRNQLDD